MIITTVRGVLHKVLAPHWRFADGALAGVARSGDGKNRNTRRRSHLVGVDDLTALLPALFLGNQDEAFALARVHPLATMVEALADALTLAAIAAEAGDQRFLLLLALAGAGVLGTGRICDKGDCNRGRNYRSSGVHFHRAQLYLQFRVIGNSEFAQVPGRHGPVVIISEGLLVNGNFLCCWPCTRTRRLHRGAVAWPQSFIPSHAICYRELCRKLFPKLPRGSGSGE